MKVGTMHPLSGQTLVFLPGMDGTGISFEPLGKILPEDVRFKVIRYPAERLLSFEETVQCAADQIGDDGEDAILLAESFSGPVAIELVSSGRIKAQCLILCSTFASSPRPLLFKILGHLPLEPLIRMPFPRFLLKHAVEGGEKATDLFISMWHRVKALVPAKVLVHRLKLISEVDVRRRLPELTLPCLYIQASGDRSVPATSLADFTQSVADLRVRRIKGPHYILQAEPQACLEAIQDFASRITKFGDKGSAATPWPPADRKTTGRGDTFRLYNDLAWLWPMWGDHASEYTRYCDFVVGLIHQHSLRPVGSMLNIACGGGKNVFNLKKHFAVTGLDLSPAMLDGAVGLNPECEFVEGDMRSFTLGRTFDAILIDDGISSMTSRGELAAAFQAAFRHLEPGGVMVVTADVTKENFVQNETTFTPASGKSKPETMEIVFIENVFDPDPEDDHYEAVMIYLIRENGLLRVETDRSLLGIYSLGTWRRTLSETGFAISEEIFKDSGLEYITFACTKPL
jgi:SAM-dependent methyltransferase/pimeloyl-ACP methyl ester carboxylesterase